MSGKTIGINMNNGFAGSYARQPDMIIDTLANVDTAAITFGAPVMLGTGGVKNTTAATAMTTFLGIAAKEVKTALTYLTQSNGGQYAVSEPVPVFERGSINVICSNGTPAENGAVYLALTTSAWSGAAVGQLGAAATGTAGTDYLVLTNARWGGAKDANNVAELVLLSRANA